MKKHFNSRQLRKRSTYIRTSLNYGVKNVYLRIDRRTHTHLKYYFPVNRVVIIANATKVINSGLRIIIYFRLYV